MEILVYVLNGDFIDELNIPLKEFVNKTEALGGIYTLKKFIEAFNEGDVNTTTDYIRFGIVDDNGNLFELPENMLVEVKNLNTSK